VDPKSRFVAGVFFLPLGRATSRLQFLILLRTRVFRPRENRDLENPLTYLCFLVLVPPLQ